MENLRFLGGNWKVSKAPYGDIDSLILTLLLVTQLLVCPLLHFSSVPTR